MPYLIGLVVIYLAVAWVREQLGITWQQFGALAIGLPLILWLATLTFRAFTQQPPAGRPNPNEAEHDPLTSKRLGRALPSSVEVLDVSDAPLVLRYQDRDGEVTERVVIPRTLHRTRAGDGSVGRPRLIAYCTLRKAVRSFSLARVQWAADAETGEIIDPLGDYLRVDRP